MNRLQTVRRRKRGSIAITTAILTMALAGMATLGVDVAHLLETKGQLSQAADASALAAVSGLLISQDEAVSRGRQYARMNPVLGKPIPAQTVQMTFGQWNFGTSTFVPGVTPYNSVKVSIALNDKTDPAAPSLFFAKALGLGQANISSAAVASLGNRDIVLVLDRSGSMDDDTVRGGPPQPLTATKEAAKRFVDRIGSAFVDKDQMGLVWFSDRASLNTPLTTEFNRVKTGIDAATAAGWTNIADGARVAHNELLSVRANTRSVATIVLLSDGKTNTLIGGTPGQYNGAPPGNPAEKQALDEAVKIGRNNIILHTISLGNDTNQNLMTQMAEATGGQHFFAPTTQQLDDIFDEISNRVPVMLVE